MKRVALIVCVLLLLTGSGLYFLGRPAYRHYKEKHSFDQAKRFLAKEDFRNAELSARRTLQINSRNLEACELMAILAERSRSPALLDWRRRLVELAPTIENKLRLAVAALRTQPPSSSLARQILDELADRAKDITAYHLVSAEFALRSRDFGEAEARFQEASRLEPSNQQHQLNLAVLRLQSTNAVMAANACATLERLRSDTNLALVALRWLIAGRLGTRELSAAQRLSQELVHDSQATTEDRLQYLTILHEATSPEFENYLAELQRTCATNAIEIYGLSTWMIGHKQPEVALQWLTNCPAKVRAEQPAPLALVECYLATKDWHSLETFLKSENWSDLDFLRLAFLSRAVSEQNAARGAEALWHQAVRSAGDRFGPLTTLLGLAGNWGLDKAKEELLWYIVQHFPRQRWACLDLSHLYQSTGNTRGLNKICSLMVSSDPKDVFAQNNLATTSLLLKQSLPKAHELAKTVYQQRPAEPTIVSTYAYSLHLQGRTTEALDVFETLKAKDLEQPAIALYYGALLSANGHTSKAERYIEIAKANASTFLPEEKALMQQ